MAFSAFSFPKIFSIFGRNALCDKKHSLRICEEGALCENLSEESDMKNLFIKNYINFFKKYCSFFCKKSKYILICHWHFYQLYKIEKNSVNLVSHQRTPEGLKKILDTCALEALDILEGTSAHHVRIERTPKHLKLWDRLCWGWQKHHCINKTHEFSRICWGKSHYSIATLTPSAGENSLQLLLKSNAISVRHYSYPMALCVYLHKKWLESNAPQETLCIIAIDRFFHITIGCFSGNTLVFIRTETPRGSFTPEQHIKNLVSDTLHTLSQKEKTPLSALVFFLEEETLDPLQSPPSQKKLQKPPLVQTVLNFFLPKPNRIFSRNTLEGEIKSAPEPVRLGPNLFGEKHAFVSQGEEQNNLSPLEEVKKNQKSLFSLMQKLFPHSMILGAALCTSVLGHNMFDMALLMEKQNFGAPMVQRGHWRKISKKWMNIFSLFFLIFDCMGMIYYGLQKCETHLLKKQCQNLTRTLPSYALTKGGSSSIPNSSALFFRLKSQQRKMDAFLRALTPLVSKGLRVYALHISPKIMQVYCYKILDQDLSHDSSHEEESALTTLLLKAFPQAYAIRAHRSEDFNRHHIYTAGGNEEDAWAVLNQHHEKEALLNLERQFSPKKPVLLEIPSPFSPEDRNHENL